MCRTCDVRNIMRRERGMLKRILTVILVVIVCFMYVSFSSCIFESLNHECIGDGCAVCNLCNTVENIIKLLFGISLICLIIKRGECIDIGFFNIGDRMIFNCNPVEMKVCLRN